MALMAMAAQTRQVIAFSWVIGVVTVPKSCGPRALWCTVSRPYATQINTMPIPV